MIYYELMKYGFRSFSHDGFLFYNEIALSTILIILERTVSFMIDHKEERIVLCGANSYEQKYYFNEQFSNLPESIRQELQIMCVLYTEDVGGILTLEFEEDGSLEFKVTAPESDYLFDEIGSVLKIKQYQMEKRDLLEALEMYYRVFYLGEEMDEEEES